MLLNFQENLKHKPLIISPTLLDHLQTGGVLFAPTNTVFGIICLEKEKIREIKKKSPNAPLQLLATKHMAQKFLAQEVVENEVFALLTSNFWTGALSIIADTTAGKRECFRVPDYPVLLNLLTHLDKPLFASSLNVHGEEELWKRDKIKKFAIQTKQAIWVIYEKQMVSKASTVIDFYCSGKSTASFKILRAGCLSKTELCTPLLQAGYQILPNESEVDTNFTVYPPPSKT